MVFTKKIKEHTAWVFENEIIKQSLKVLGWRKVPVNHEVVGTIASETEPQIMQIFVVVEKTAHCQIMNLT